MTAMSGEQMEHNVNYWRVVCTNFWNGYSKPFYFETREAAYRFYQFRISFKVDDHVEEPEPVTAFDIIRDTK